MFPGYGEFSQHGLNHLEKIKKDYPEIYNQLCVQYGMIIECLALQNRFGVNPELDRSVGGFVQYAKKEHLSQENLYELHKPKDENNTQNLPLAPIIIGSLACLALCACGIRGIRFYRGRQNHVDRENERVTAEVVGAPQI